nr:DNA/RNA polymerases superfamily protein [Tanacetum cinerariifolium]
TETRVSRLVFGKVCRKLGKPCLSSVLPFIPRQMVGERVIEGPEMIKVTNTKVAVAKEKLKEARTRQKSYADKHRRSLEFHPGDHVFLKVSPARGVRRFGYKYHPLHVISYPLDRIRTDLSYIEEPEAILDRQDRVMRKKTIPFVKIL